MSSDLGLAPIHYAVHSGSAAKVKALLESERNHADVDLQTQDAAQSPLHLAAEAGQADLLEVLLDIPSPPPNVHARDAFGVTPLFVAAREGHEDCVRVLLSHGSDLQFRGGTENLSVREVCQYTGSHPILMPRLVDLCFQLLRQTLPNLDLSDRSLYSPRPFVRKTPEDLDEVRPIFLLYILASAVLCEKLLSWS